MFATGEVILVLLDGSRLEKEIVGLSGVGERETRVVREGSPMSQFTRPRASRNDDRPEYCACDWFSPAVTVYENSDPSATGCPSVVIQDPLLE